MATLKDVAKKAGVSLTTASRALNNFPEVNIDTKNKVKLVAESLNYVPNKAAQNLAKRENKKLAFILSGLDKEGGKDAIIYRLLSGMFAYAVTIDYELVLYTVDTAYQLKKSYLQFCKENNISGAIINGIRLDDPYLEEIMESTIPCVFIDLELTSENVSCVTIDNVKASREAMDLLIKANHQHIGLINGRREAYVSTLRLEGYKQGLLSNGIRFNQDYVKYADFSEDLAYEKTKTLLIENPQITAIFCVSDIMAMSVMRAAKEIGRKVPEDLSLIGFDDIPLAEFYNPPLTTIHQDFYVMGYTAGNQLMKLIEKKEVNRVVYLEYEIIERETVAEPRLANRC